MSSGRNVSLKNKDKKFEQKQKNELTNVAVLLYHIFRFEEVYEIGGESCL